MDVLVYATAAVWKVADIRAQALLRQLLQYVCNSTCMYGQQVQVPGTVLLRLLTQWIPTVDPCVLVKVGLLTPTVG